MSKVNPTGFLTASGSYCSQAYHPPLHVRTIDEGVAAIENILERELLCKHDVDEINQIYNQIDLLEKKIDKAGKSSFDALTSVIEKVRSIIQRTALEPTDIITLYHLQNFVESGLGIDEIFRKLKVKEKVDNRTIADSLPFCESEEQFKTDSAALLDTSDPTVADILTKKTTLFQKAQLHQQEIQKRKTQLDDLRDKEPAKYPAYLEEILEAGCVHLYDHLLEIRTRELNTRDKIQLEILDKIDFSSLSHIILETRQAVIQKVKSAIPHPQNVIFLLGGSGAGKSTTLCFLTGDELLLKGFKYEAKSDRNRYIGDAQATSFTFLPNIEVVKDFVIVDFPGFDDTNGELISMGMELALKALIQEYRPKILVLEAITNIEGRYAAAAQLAMRLDRILDHKEQCLLGITKYTKDPDMIALRSIEEQQKRDLSTPTDQEKRLVTEIQMLEKNIKKYNDADDIKDKTAKESELKQLQQRREKNQNQVLPDTEAKKKHRAAIAERELELSKQIGLSQIIKFDDLTNPHALTTCIKELALPSEKNVSSNPSRSLAAHNRSFLVERFRKQLRLQLLSVDKYESNTNAFQQSILDYSLIHTILRAEAPEVGDFLHLPEIDATLVSEFDKDIAEELIKKYMHAIIGSLNIASMNKILNELEKKGYDVKVLRSQFTKLTDYILGLLGKDSLKDDPKKAEAEWGTLEKRYTVVEGAVEERFGLPFWLKVVMGAPVGIPLGIHALWKNYALNSELNQITASLVAQYANEFTAMERTLRELKNIENLILKKEEIIAAFNSAPISLESFEKCEASILTKIKRVRQAYGEKEWDTRLAFFIDKLSKMEGSFRFTMAYFLAPLLDSGIALEWKASGKRTDQEWMRFPLLAAYFLGAFSSLVFFRSAISLTFGIKSAFRLVRADEMIDYEAPVADWIDMIKHWNEALTLFHSLGMNLDTPLNRATVAAVIFEFLSKKSE